MQGNSSDVLLSLAKNCIPCKTFCSINNKSCKNKRKVLRALQKLEQPQRQASWEVCRESPSPRYLFSCSILPSVPVYSPPPRTLRVHRGLGRLGQSARSAHLPQLSLSCHTHILNILVHSHTTRSQGTPVSWAICWVSALLAGALPPPPSAALPPSAAAAPSVSAAPDSATRLVPATTNQIPSCNNQPDFCKARNAIGSCNNQSEISSFSITRTPILFTFCNHSLLFLGLRKHVSVA